MKERFKTQLVKKIVLVLFCEDTFYCFMYLFLIFHTFSNVWPFIILGVKHPPEHLIPWTSAVKFYQENVSFAKYLVCNLPPELAPVTWRDWRIMGHIARSLWQVYKCLIFMAFLCILDLWGKGCSRKAIRVYEAITGVWVMFMVALKYDFITLQD